MASAKVYYNVGCENENQGGIYEEVSPQESAEPQVLVDLGNTGEVNSPKSDIHAVKTESRRSVILITVLIVVLTTLSATAISLAFLQVNGLKRELSELREAGNTGYSNAANLSNELTEHSEQSRRTSASDRIKIETNEESIGHISTELQNLRDDQSILVNTAQLSDLQFRVENMSAVNARNLDMVQESLNGITTTFVQQTIQNFTTLENLLYSQAATLSNKQTEHSQQSQRMTSIDRRRMETIEESIRHMTTDLRALREVTSVVPSCPTGYILNPVSFTCIRLVGPGDNWDEAKANCEAQGETLAVFTTRDSINWIRDYVRHSAPSDWRLQCQWIGLRHNGTAWYWRGRDTSPLSVSSSLWDSYEPDTNNAASCGYICMYDNSYNELHDCSCSQTVLYSLCERSSI